MKNKQIRNIIITGGASGMGKGLVEKFRANGDNVFVLDLSNGENMKGVYLVDISNFEEVSRVINQIGEDCLKTESGKIDVLINCAGYGISGVSELIDIKTVDKLFAVNFTGTANATNAALKFMKEGSKVINFGSMMALLPVPFRAYYGAVKAAVRTFSFGQRMELDKSGIQVSVISPGQVKTNFSKNRVKLPETNERYGNRPISAQSDVDKTGRMPAEVAVKAVFKFVNKKKMPPELLIGGSYKFLNFISKCFPISVYLHFASKVCGGKF